MTIRVRLNVAHYIGNHVYQRDEEADMPDDEFDPESKNYTRVDPAPDVPAPEPEPAAKKPHVTGAPK